MIDIKLSFEQVKSLADELQEVGQTMFLVKHHAIKVLPDGTWAVLQYEGLKLALIEALPGLFYQNDVPYTFWQEVLRQVNYFIYKRDLRAKEQAKALAPKI